MLILFSSFFFTESGDGFWEEDTCNAENVYHDYSDTDTDDDNVFRRAKYQRVSNEKDIARNRANNFDSSNQKSKNGECSSSLVPIEEGKKISRSQKFFAGSIDFFFIP